MCVDLINSLSLVMLEIYTNIGSDNGLLPEGMEPLPIPMLTSYQ